MPKRASLAVTDPFDDKHQSPGSPAESETSTRDDVESNFSAMRFPNFDSSRRTESNEAVTHDTSCSRYEQGMRDTEMRFSSHASMRLKFVPAGYITLQQPPFECRAHAWPRIWVLT
jgi:hypothetical protein